MSEVRTPSVTWLEIVTAIMATAAIASVALFFVVPDWRTWLGGTAAGFGTVSLVLGMVCSERAEVGR